MAGKVGCGVLLAVLFAVAAVSRCAVCGVSAGMGSAGGGVSGVVCPHTAPGCDGSAAAACPPRAPRRGICRAGAAAQQPGGGLCRSCVSFCRQWTPKRYGDELPCGAMLAPGQRADLRVTLRAAKSGLWRFRVQGNHGARPAGPVCRALRRAAPKPGAVCAAARRGVRTMALAQSRKIKVEKVTAAGPTWLTASTICALPCGDSLKQIHWKLTARVGELTVREPLGATYCAEPAGAIMAEGRCAAAGAALWSDCRKTAAHHDRHRTADPDTGLVFIDRVLLPRTGAAARPVLETTVDLLILELLALGLLTALNGAFALALPVWVWLGMAAMLCPVWRRCTVPPLPNAARRGMMLALAVGYLVLLFVLQRTFLAGAQQCADAVRLCLNTRFDNANFAVETSPIPAQGAVVCAAGGDPCHGVSGRSNQPGTPMHCCWGWRCCRSWYLHCWPGRQRRFGLAAAFARLVGGLRRRHGRCSENGCGAARIPAAYANLPDPPHKPKNWPLPVWRWPARYCFCLHWRCARCFTLPLNALQPVTDKAQAAVLSAAIEWLPKISNGALNFHLSAAAGGVEDGSLTQGDGLALTGLEDLMVTASAMPEETVYLRGFIGADYDGTSWQAGDAAAFDSAASTGRPMATVGWL